VKNGKIQAIGEKVELPRPCKVIDATKLVAMPGHVAPHSRISLMDFPRAGARADLKVADEFFPAADAFDVPLAAGFTTLQLVPPGAWGSRAARWSCAPPTSAPASWSSRLARSRSTS
jgi:hypothetical protein